MWSWIRDNWWAALLALAVHLGFLALLVVSFSSVAPLPVAGSKTEVIKAVAVDENKVQQELDKLRQQEQHKRAVEDARQRKLAAEARAAEQARVREQKRVAELKRQQIQEQKQLEQQRKQRAAQEKAEQARQAKLKAEQEAQRKAEAQHLAKVKAEQQAEQARLEKLREAKAAEAKRLADLAAKRKAEEQKQREEEQRQAREADLRKQMAAEESARAAQRQRQLATLTEQYKAAIADRVRSNWLRPPNVPTGATCQVDVSQLPGGDVGSVRVSNCTANDEVLRRSVETAVLKSSPLPMAPDPAVFDRHIRFIFEVKD